MSHNEWELLEISEDIEQGDTIVIDDDGEEIVMIFVKYTKGVVTLRKGDSVRKFRASSLEEIDGNACIVGKNE